jgi:hypothetical protein
LPTGIQRHLLHAAVPAGDRSLQAGTPTTALAAVASVKVPIGPSGQILGQLDEGTLVAVPLWDQSGNPKRQRIDARVGVAVARQLVLRAVVTGAVVAIHTDDRQRWQGLVATVNDDQRLFYATAGARTCDIAVFDGRTVTTVPARTVLRLLGDEHAGGGADMTIVEGPGQVLDVTIAGSDPVTLWAIRTREEDRYLGLGLDQIPQPRRQVSTAPALTRTPRRPAPPPEPRRRPAAPDRQGAPTGQASPAPLRTPAATPQPVRGNDEWTGAGANGGGGRHHRDFGVPQRVPRSNRPTTAPESTPPPPARRRDYRLPPPPDQQQPPPRR